MGKQASLEPEEIPDAEYELIIERVAAIDVAKASGKVCVRASKDAAGRRSSRVWDVAATTGAITELAAQLMVDRIDRVTVESTSDYWRIWYYLLESAGLSVQLVNARDVKNVPGRSKTDLLTELPQASFGAGACREGFGWLGSLLVMGDGDLPRDLAVLVVPGRGGLEATGDLFQPYRLVDADGAVVAPVAAYFAELSACGRPATHSAFVWDGSVAVVSVPVGAGGGLGSGDSGGSPRFLSLAADRGQAGPASLAAPGRRCCRRGAVTDRAGRECGDRQGGSR